MMKPEIIEIPDDSYISRHSNEVIIISSEPVNSDQTGSDRNNFNEIEEDIIEHGSGISDNVSMGMNKWRESVITPSSPIGSIDRKIYKHTATVEQPETLFVNSSFDSANNMNTSLLKEESRIENVFRGKNNFTSPNEEKPHIHYNQENVLDIGNWISSDDDSGISRFISTASPCKRRVERKNRLDNRSILGTKSILSPFKNVELNNSFILSDPISENSSSPLKNFNPEDEIRKSKKISKGVKSNFSKSKQVSLPSKFANNLAISQKELKEANKVTRSKEELLSEMIIHIPNELYNADFDDEYFQSKFNSTELSLNSSSLPLITWSRKVSAVYDSEYDLFIPCPQTTIKERNIVIYYKASELIPKMQDGSFKNIVDECISNCRSENNDLDYSIIVIIEGYDQYLSKLRRSENKKYKNAVLNKFISEEPEPSRKRKKREEISLDISAKDVEYLINETQLVLDINIFPVKSSQEGIDWLLSFTYTIAFRLYDKFERNHSLANLGNVRSGVDTKSTFLQTIRQFKLMTEPRAERLYGFHKSLYSIYHAYKTGISLGSDNFGKNIVPPTADSAMKNIFTSDNPNDLIHD